MSRHAGRGGALLAAALLLMLGACSRDPDPEHAAPTTSGVPASVDPAGSSPYINGLPLRELPGLAAYDDLDDAALLGDVFAFPPQIAVPPLTMNRAFTEAQTLEDDPFFTYGTGWEATGAPEEVFATAETAVDSGFWTVETELGLTESGYYEKRWTAESADVHLMRFAYWPNDEVLAVIAYGEDGAVTPPSGLWPWAEEVPAPPGAAADVWRVQIPDGRGQPALLLDQRWTAPAGSYDEIAAFVDGLGTGEPSAPSLGPLTIGESFTDESPRIATGVAVTGPDRFEGRYWATVADPAAGPLVVLEGTVPLEEG